MAGDVLPLGHNRAQVRRLRRLRRKLSRIDRAADDVARERAADARDVHADRIESARDSVPVEDAGEVVLDPALRDFVRPVRPAAMPRGDASRGPWGPITLSERAAAARSDDGRTYTRDRDLVERSEDAERQEAASREPAHRAEFQARTAAPAMNFGLLSALAYRRSFLEGR